MERERRLPWEPTLLAELLHLSWPITVSMISYSVMTLVDTLLVGRMGAAQLAGVGLGGTATFVLLWGSFGLLRGAKTLVAQAIGAGRSEAVGPILGAAVWTALAIGAATILLGQLLGEVLVHLCATTAAGLAARTYVRIRILGAPLALLYVALREVRYGLGDARSPMRATVAANVVNIALACLFVLGLKMGVAGAALATVIAHGVEAGWLALSSRRRSPGEMFALKRASARHLRALWRIGLPTGLQFMLEVGAFAVLAAMVASMSEVDMAAHQVALQVIHFSFLPAFAVGEAASVLAGQAVGADRDAVVLRVAHRALLAAGVYTGACTVALAGFAPLIASGFTGSQALLALAVRLLHVAAVFQVFDGANVIARAVLRGVGDVRYAAWMGVITSWALTPPLTWLLGFRLKLGAFGGWLGLCCEIIVGAVLLWIRLERRSWRPAAEAIRAELARSGAAQLDGLGITEEELPVPDALATRP